MTRSILSLAALATCLFAAAPAVADSSPPAAAPDPTATVTDELGLPCDIVIAPRAAAVPGGKARKAKAVRSPDTRALATGLGRGASFALDRAERGGRDHRDGRDAATPRADAELRMEGASVSATAVGVVVRERMGELEYCMTRLPKGTRDGSIGLALTIEPRGNVSAARVVGGPRDKAFTACVVGQAKRWSFPAGDVSTEIEYPVMLNGQR